MSLYISALYLSSSGEKWPKVVWSMELRVCSYCKVENEFMEVMLLRSCAESFLLKNWAWILILKV